MQQVLSTVFALPLFGVSCCLLVWLNLSSKSSHAGADCPSVVHGDSGSGSGSRSSSEPPYTAMLLNRQFPPGSTSLFLPQVEFQSALALVCTAVMALETHIHPTSRDHHRHWSADSLQKDILKATGISRVSQHKQHAYPISRCSAHV